MSLPYVGEIRLFAGDFAPAGWCICDGSLLPVSEHEVLFSLIGTTYGGDGELTFAVPDLRGRVPQHVGGGFILAETGGVETHTLSTSQVPAHSHAAVVSSAFGQQSSPLQNVPAQDSQVNRYGGAGTSVSFPAARVSSAGGSAAHDNMQPYTVINYIISLYGIYPSAT